MGSKQIGTQRALLRKALLEKDPAKFDMRILMLDPLSEAALERAQEIKEGRNAMVEGILFAIREALEIRAETHLKIQVNCYSEQPTWRLFIFDDIAFVSSFQNDKNGDQTNMLKFHKNSSDFFGAFERQFESVWRKSRPAEVAASQARGDRVSFLDAVSLLNKYCDRRLIWHCKTVSNVARDIAVGTKKKYPQIDLELVEIGALLHDIGKSKTTKLNHAYLGAQMVREATTLFRNADFREAVARIVERHTGVGLNRAAIRQINEDHKLDIPEIDYIPTTLEEIIVSYADKLVVADQPRTFEEQLYEKKIKWGEHSQFVKTMLEWQVLLGEPVH